MRQAVKADDFLGDAAGAVGSSIQLVPFIGLATSSILCKKGALKGRLFGDVGPTECGTNNV